MSLVTFKIQTASFAHPRARFVESMTIQIESHPVQPLGKRKGSGQDSIAALAQKASETSVPASRTGTVVGGSPRLQSPLVSWTHGGSCVAIAAD